MFVLLLAFSGMQPQADCTPQFAQLETGTYSGASAIPFWSKDEAGAWGGSGWFGWSWKSEVVQPVQLIVRDRPKDFPDDDGHVTVESVPDVTFAARCVAKLRAGPIVWLGIANHDLPYRGPLTISLYDRQYTLQLETNPGNEADQRVILSEGQRTQVLYATQGLVDDPHFYIEWAGDLDQDRRLDLIVNLSRQYSVHPRQLLLSSHASDSELVGEAAVFETRD